MYLYTYTYIQCTATVKKLVQIITGPEDETLKHLNQKSTFPSTNLTRIKCISNNKYAIIELYCNIHIAIEVYNEFNVFGRFILRNKGMTCATGKCIYLI